MNEMERKQITTKRDSGGGGENEKKSRVYTFVPIEESFVLCQNELE
jgi:hypothetical protein